METYTLRCKQCGHAQSGPDLDRIERRYEQHDCATSLASESTPSRGAALLFGVALLALFIVWAVGAFTN